jgi:hypothetical protein
MYPRSYVIKSLENAAKMQATDVSTGGDFVRVKSLQRERSQEGQRSHISPNNARIPVQHATA